MIKAILNPGSTSTRRLTIQFMSGILLLFLLACLSLSHAGKLYKWVDAEGNVHFSDQVPPEDAKRQRKVLSPTGRTIKTIDAAKTPEQIAEEKRRKRIEAEQHRKEAEQRERDRVLLLTFQNVKHIISTRDAKITTIDSSIQLTSNQLKVQENRLQEYLRSAAEFERNGKVAPKHIIKKINATRSQIDKILHYIDKKKEEKRQIFKEFAAYEKRYKELQQEIQ
jgi:hypothetical protein